MDIVLGYALALVIGLVIGILGGGGSILTVPVLVYLLKISPVIATAYSLFVVGTSSLFGTFQNIRKGIINFKVGFIFAFPSLIAVYATRKYLLPNIPDTIDTGIFILFKRYSHNGIFCIHHVPGFLIYDYQKERSKG